MALVESMGVKENIDRIHQQPSSSSASVEAVLLPAMEIKQVILCHSTCAISLAFHSDAVAVAVRLEVASNPNLLLFIEWGNLC